MSDATARRVAWAVFALCAIGSIGAVVMGVLVQEAKARSDYGEVVFTFFFTAAMFTFPVVGILIASRQPRSAIAWILLGIGLVWGLGGDLTGNYVLYGLVANPGSLPGAAVVAALFGGTWVPGVGLIGTFLILLFPDGRLPSPRWRALAWASALVIALLTLAIPLTPESLPETAGEPALPDIPNPLGLEALAPYMNLIYGLLPVLPVCMVGCALGAVARFRRSKGRERLQLKWLAAGAGLSAAIYLVAMVSSLVTDAWFAASNPLWINILQHVALFSFVLIPLAIGIAILRHRLYDIDVIITKTFVFGTLAAFITAVYVAVVVGLGALLGSGGEPSVALSIVATALVAVAFQPVRARVERIANRLVYGQRATPYEVLSHFSRSLAGVVSVDEVVRAVARLTAEGLRAGSVVATATLPAGEVSVRHPDDAAPSPGAGETVDIAYRGERLGSITVTRPPTEPLTRAEHKLLAELAAHAGVALHNARLAGELRARLHELTLRAAELRDSRERLVTAADTSRRAIERAIREGVEARLVAIAHDLERAEAALLADPGSCAELLDDIAERTNETLDALRDLARGIFPPLLADKGLVMALEAHVRKSALDVELVVDDGLATARFERAVETAAYFCLREALDNVARHAPGAPASVRLERSDGRLAFAVEDGGPGFDVATTPPGQGMHAMTDRVAALGGDLTVTSSPGHGTAVRGWLPVGAAQPAAQPPVAAAHASSS